MAFQDVLLAYRILSDEERRKEYDQTGEDAGDAPAEERKVRVSDLATLRSAIENHRWAGSGDQFTVRFASLPMQGGALGTWHGQPGWPDRYCSVR